MKEVVFDIEADSLDATKIHCLSANMDNKIGSTTDYARMARLVVRKDVILVGHNIVRYDIPTLERLLGVSIECTLVDTLAISWYLDPTRKRHGLEEYGEEYGIPKPKIDDWENLSTEEYVHRCEEDVKINTRLWKDQRKMLMRLYGSEEEMFRLIAYLTFKMQCAADQEKYRWKLDVDRCKQVLAKLEEERLAKVEMLGAVMPKVPVIKKKTRPAKPYKKDRSYSAVGQVWFDLLKENNLPEDYDGVVEVVAGYAEPNPQSHDQIKDWLYGLGWVPSEFKYVRNKETGELKKIPQVSVDSKHPDYPSVSPCVKRLFDKEPSLEHLNGLFLLAHRISVLNGFLKNVDADGYIRARVAGFTNTLRFKHAEVVNLPGIDKPHGLDMRGVLTVESDEYELCGSDCASLEDRTKQHYMFKHDPDYVAEMNTDDFDPHIDLAVFAGAMSKVDAAKYKKGEEKGRLGPIRKVYKSVNYACVYGAGGPRVAITAGVSEAEGNRLVEAYWRRNWSVKAIAQEQTVKQCGGQKWLFNPVSKFWYSLRHDKDRFSTLNQGTGVYCFDTWIKHTKNGGPPMIAQFHDEGVWLIRKGRREKMTAFLKGCMKKTNEELKLNRDLDCSVDFGHTYADIH